MIRLSVEPYCANCEKFEPIVERQSNVDFYGNILIDTFITCENADQCRNMMCYLKKGLKKNNG